VITHGGCRFQKCRGSLRGFAPDGGRAEEDEGSRGGITVLAVLNRGTGNWAGSSGATKSLNDGQRGSWS